jgi:hypothetical protein
MDDKDILHTVTELMEEEHELRTRMQAGSITEDEEHRRLQTLEESLDQCWDLLRQRRARLAAGQDPDEAKVRDVNQVENYRQ